SQAGQLKQVVELRGMLLEFIPVALLEIRPQRRIMTEPLSQVLARGDLAQPAIDRCLRLRHTARPQSVDEDARTVVCGRWLICPLEPDVGQGIAHGHLSEKHSRGLQYARQATYSSKGGRHVRRDRQGPDEV